jgi:transposase
LKRKKTKKSVAHLSDHDLRQMDEAWLARVPESTLREVSVRLLQDLRCARDQLNRNPSNSSRPSGSMEPWLRTKAGSEDAPDVDASGAAAHTEGEVDPEVKGKAAEADCGPGQAQDWAGERRMGKPGKPAGSPGYGRTQKLAVTHTEHHFPGHCAACGAALPQGEPAQAWHGWDCVEMVGVPQQLGWQLQVTRHLLMHQRCQCGHLTRAQAHCAEEDAQWHPVAMGEQRLLGPRLAACIVYLSHCMRLSRRKVRELMKEVWGLQLSVGLIDQTVQQAARSVAPLEDDLLQELNESAVVYADETSWNEAGLRLWLWVFAATHTVLLVIGPRAKEMLDNVLNHAFKGSLMSDGYAAYRSRGNRLRCWAHLLRKLRGLAESTHPQASRLGGQWLKHLKTLKRAIYAMRGTDPPSLLPQITHEHVAKALQRSCERHRDHAHEPLREVARELLNDWDVIMRPLAEPHLPLTNNEAERALRHHVIARRISQGTRTPAGSRGYALLASVAQTCRLRSASVIDLLARVIDAARKGMPIPPLPPIPAA